MTDAIKVYKGFDKDWKCRDYQFKIGETFVHAGATKLCKEGFHACEYPMDIFNYYPPTGQMAECELSGLDSELSDDSKRAGKNISIKLSLTIPMLVTAAIEYTTSCCNPADAKHSDADRSASSATGGRSASSSTGYSSASSATGDSSASSSTGYSSASSSTHRRSASSATGDSSASSATGYRSASSATGDRSASSATGDRSVSSATGDISASSATGDRSASSATGDRSVSSATGYRSASSSTGYRSASSATGDNAVAAAFGLCSKAKAGDSGIIIVAWWDNSVTPQRKRITTGYVGEGKIKADTWYVCDTKGKLVEF